MHDRVSAVVGIDKALTGIAGLDELSNGVCRRVG